jgi:hypothetical protein
MLAEVLDEIPEEVVKAICDDPDEFVKITVGVRNALTHMQGKSKLPLATASYVSKFLTWKLIALFCIHDWLRLGYPLDNIWMTLTNNELARAALRPLPKL